MELAGHGLQSGLVILQLGSEFSQSAVKSEVSGGWELVMGKSPSTLPNRTSYLSSILEII